MKNFIHKIFSKKKTVLTVALLCLATFLIAHSSLAATTEITNEIGKAVATVLSWIAWVWLAVFGLLLTLMVKILVNVAMFSNIINVPTVITGWVIIRDLCNMSFILILLVIAFATILRQENYSAKRILPKLLIMAVMINFSRTIFGLMIDFSQVVMLTFVNGFAQYGPGNLINMFQTNKITAMWDGSDATINSWSIVVAIIAGVIAIIITNIVVLIMIAVLVIRIILLWIYTILSPLVFLGFAFPPLQKYTARIWEDFNKQLVVGPVLAFFLWLALATVNSSATKINLMSDTSNLPVCAGLSALFCDAPFQTFIITIAFLMGGLMVAQQFGGAAGSVAGKGLAWAKRVASAPVAAGRGIGRGAVGVADWGARKVKVGAVSDLLAKRVITGKDAEGRDIYKWKSKVPGLGGLASALYGLELRPTRMIQGFREGMKAKAEREESQATGAAAVSLKKGGALGLVKGLGVSRDLAENLVGPGGFLWRKGFKRVLKGTVGGTTEKVDALEKEIKSKKANRGLKMSEYSAMADEQGKEYLRRQKEVKETERQRDAAAARGDNVSAVKFGDLAKKQTAELSAYWDNMGKDLKQARDRVVSDEQRDKNDQEIKRLEKDFRLRTPLQTFYADRAREKLVSESSRTLGDNDNEEFLVDAFNGALVNGNRELAQAVMLHAASVGHLNEIIQGYRSKRDVKDEYGQTIVKAGDLLPQGGYGLSELVKQALIEDLGIDEETAIMTQSEASTMAKGVKHSNLSESVGSKNGRLYQRPVQGIGGQRHRARSEARKVDAERFARDFNRLAWGDEYEIAQADGSTKRVFKLNELGLDNFVELAPTLWQEAGERGRFNKNAAMNIANDAETLRAFAKKLDDAEMTFKAGKDKDPHKYMELADKIIEYGEEIARTQREEGEKDSVKVIQKEILDQQRKS